MLIIENAPQRIKNGFECPCYNRETSQISTLVPSIIAKRRQSCHLPLLSLCIVARLEKRPEASTNRVVQDRTHAALCTLRSKTFDKVIKNEYISSLSWWWEFPARSTSCTWQSRQRLLCSIHLLWQNVHKGKHRVFSSFPVNVVCACSTNTIDPQEY